MDDQRFDRFTRAFSAATSRRQTMGFIAATMALAWSPHRALALQDATPSPSCAPGQATCGGVCVDTCCNNDHCGACGNTCTPPFTCFEGQCDCPSGLCCAEGETACNGACVATCCDNANCGACGHACDAGYSCFEGVCDCPSGACAPVTLPNTGSGSTPPQDAQRGWAAMALASAAAILGTVWSRRGGVSVCDGDAADLHGR
jgi:hypothetical protein